MRKSFPLRSSRRSTLEQYQKQSITLRESDLRLIQQQDKIVRLTTDAAAQATLVTRLREQNATLKRENNMLTVKEAESKRVLHKQRYL